MPTPEWTFSVATSPQRAPENYRTLPPSVRIDHGDWTWGLWHGSGFQVVDLPCYPAGKNQVDYHHDEATQCGHCGSRETRCIYLHNRVDQSGADIDLEIECSACGRYTLYNGYA